jgi:hypothetical protein
MGISWDIVKEIFPSLKDAVKDGVVAFRTSKRKRRNIFVLKAIVALPDESFPWPHTNGMAFDLPFIEMQIIAAIIGEATGRTYQKTYLAKGMYDAFFSEEDRAKCRAVAKKYGLPVREDKNARQKIENVLHEMVEDGKLRFLPPERWSIV